MSQTSPAAAAVHQVFAMLNMHKHVQASLPVLEDLLTGASGSTDRSESKQQAW